MAADRDPRSADLFYLGHIPAFLDIFLSKSLQEPHSEPEYFKVGRAASPSSAFSTLILSSDFVIQDIFERGIDPNVDDPTLIHVSRVFLPIRRVSRSESFPGSSVPLTRPR